MERELCQQALQPQMQGELEAGALATAAATEDTSPIILNRKNQVSDFALALLSMIGVVVAALFYEG